jgi:hypothetical protein
MKLYIHEFSYWSEICRIWIQLLRTNSALPGIQKLTATSAFTLGIPKYILAKGEEFTLS